MATKKSSVPSADLRSQLEGSLISATPTDGGAVAAPVIVGDTVVWAGDAGLAVVSHRESRTVLTRAHDVLDRYKNVPGNVRAWAVGDRLLVAGDSQFTSGGTSWSLRWLDLRTGETTHTVVVAEVVAACMVGDRLVLSTRAVAEHEMLSRSRTASSGDVEWYEQPLAAFYASAELGGLFGNGAMLVLDAATGREHARVPFAPANVWQLRGLREHVLLVEFDAETGAQSTAAYRVADGGRAWSRPGSITAAGRDAVAIRDGAQLIIVGEDGTERWRTACPEQAPVHATFGADTVALVGDGTTPTATLAAKQALAVSSPIELRDAATGAVRWSGLGVNRVASIDERFVWAYTPKNELEARSATDGTSVGAIAIKDAREVVSRDGVCAFHTKTKTALDLYVYALA